MDRETRVYRFCYSVTKVLIGLFYRVKTVGKEHLPEGAAMLCANHSSWVDPALVAFALTKKVPLSIMAKKELFKSPLISGFLRGFGAFPVDRGNSDVGAIRNAISCLKKNKKLLIFPEGTRVKKALSQEAKTGAVRIAEKVGCPIVPVYVPRRKNILKRHLIIIGEPIYIEKNAGNDYHVISRRLMETIESLKTRSVGEGRA